MCLNLCLCVSMAHSSTYLCKGSTAKGTGVFVYGSLRLPQHTEVQEGGLLMQHQRAHN